MSTVVTCHKMKLKYLSIFSIWFVNVVFFTFYRICINFILQYQHKFFFVYCVQS